MLTRIQHSASGSQSGLDKYLFGQAASMVLTDVYVMGGVCLVLLVACLVWFKEFKLVSFDPVLQEAWDCQLEYGAADFAADRHCCCCRNTGGWRGAGCCFMVTPAAAARCWTNSLALMVLLAGLFGALSGAAGTLFSTLVPNLPTGPVTVLAATVLFVGSALLAPRRGLLARKLRSIQARSAYMREEQATLQMNAVQPQTQKQGRCRWPHFGLF